MLCLVAKVCKFMKQGKEVFSQKRVLSVTGDHLVGCYYYKTTFRNTPKKSFKILNFGFAKYP